MGDGQNILLLGAAARLGDEVDAAYIAALDEIRVWHEGAVEAAKGEMQRTLGRVRATHMERLEEVKARRVRAGDGIRERILALLDEDPDLDTLRARLAALEGAVIYAEVVDVDSAD